MPYMTCPPRRDLGDDDSDYMMLPGARLELGPHGTPYEQLGACCAACAVGRPCGTGDLIEYGARARRARTPALAGLPEGIPWLWVGVGAVAFLVLRKKRR